MKTDITDLALFGGEPLFDGYLHVGRPNLGKREDFLKRVEDILDRRWLTNDGPYLWEFEQRVAEKLNVEHCIAVCNGTMGLQLLATALNLEGEVIVPSFTFIATAHALQWQGLQPVFCDIDPNTHNLAPAKVEELITERTSAIVGVHLWGQACDHAALQAIANRHSIPLLFDAAHAFMCSDDGRMIGNFGGAEVLSFHATKFFNTLEGGAVVTNNAELAEKLRRLRNFGFGGGGYSNITGVGINAKMNEVSAAMGLTNLEKVDDFLKINAAHYDQYLEQLDGISGVQMLQYPIPEANNCQYIVMEIDEERAGIARNQLLEILRSEFILARRYFHPACHQAEPYKTLMPNANLQLPVTERVSDCVLVLPTGTVLTSTDVEKVTSLIRFAVQHAPQIQAQRQHNGVKSQL